VPLRHGPRTDLETCNIIHATKIASIACVPNRVGQVSASPCKARPDRARIPHGRLVAGWVLVELVAPGRGADRDADFHRLKEAGIEHAVVIAAGTDGDSDKLGIPTRRSSVSFGITATISGTIAHRSSVEGAGASGPKPRSPRP
jgi:hypothetical protein